MFGSARAERSRTGSYTNTIILFLIMQDIHREFLCSHLQGFFPPFLVDLSCLIPIEDSIQLQIMQEQDRKLCARLKLSRTHYVMQECDSIISDPEGFEELQVKAMAILIRAIVVCYSLVTDEQVVTLEEELEALKRRIAERDRADKAAA